jgi:AcrR family transcriptional regulator
VPEPSARPDLMEAPAESRPDETRQPARARRNRARRGDGERLRSEIVEAAGDLLIRGSGLGEVSLRAVAREVGVSTSAIYLHFASLEALLLEVKERFLVDFRRELNAAAATGGDDSLARVRARSHAYVAYGMGRLGIYRTLFSSPMTPPELLPTSEYLGASVFEDVQRDVSGLVGPGIEANLLSMHLWTTLHGVVTLRSDRRGFPWPDLTAHIDDVVNRYFVRH